MREEHSRRCIIGIDLGATKTLVGAADRSGRLIGTRRVPTHAPGSGDLPERLGHIIDELLDELRIPCREVMGIGIGAAGVVDAATGALTVAPGLRAGERVELAGPLRRRYGCPVLVENDVNAALLGEAWKGALQGARDAVLISIGTGIGVGLLINGALYRGAHGAAGEIGYWLIGSLGPIQGKSGYGPLEEYAAGPGIARRYAQRLGDASRTGEIPLDVTAEVVAAAAQSGDLLAREIFWETAETIGIACANLCSLLDPEIVGIGGGVAKVDESLLLEPVRRIVGAMAPCPPPVVATQLGDAAGVLGSVLMVLQDQLLHVP